MRALNINLPDSLILKMEELAQKDGISVDSFISLAVAEKISSWISEGYIQKRAKRANKEDYKQALELIPDREPYSYDKL
ncbi:MAG: toxin-antitoxin system HicB family antitoxin [Leptospiraceae bacterium]|nr:toxin-antitoxin system HicB family antitoxin [Leptospiraceae bacterium]